MAEFDNPGYNFSKFQKQFIVDKENELDFKNWVQAGLTTQVRDRQQMCFLWFTNDGALNSRHVGVNEFLGEGCKVTNN